MKKIVIFFVLCSIGIAKSYSQTSKKGNDLVILPP
jgi:hypothetical protein